MENLDNYVKIMEASKAKWQGKQSHFFMTVSCLFGVERLISRHSAESFHPVVAMGETPWRLRVVSFV